MRAVLCALLAATLLAAGPAWADTVRLGLFVGNNIGFGEDEPLRYAEQEAQDMARIFHTMGDLSRERTTVLLGVGADRFRAEMHTAEAQVREATARGDEVMLLFYYSGHASHQGLHMGGTLLPMDVLRRWLDGSAARVRVAFLDACESGSLARSRGGTPVEAIEITVDDALTLSGQAIITSTGPLSVARESESFGGGVFSRALLSGLRGTADLDGDGQVTLDEVYEHAFSETVVSTASSSDAIQKPEYRFELSGVGQVVLTRIPDRAAGLILPEELEGVYTLVSVTNGQVVARVDKAPGEVRRLALPTGRYVVRKVRREDVLVAELDLVWGGDRWLDDGQMSSVSLGDPLARGGWSPRPWRLSVLLGRGTRYIQGHPGATSLDLSLRYSLRPNLGLVMILGGETGARWEWAGRLRTHKLGLGVGLVTERRLRAVDLYLGGGVEMAEMRQAIHFVEYGYEQEVADIEVFRARQLTGGVWSMAGVHLPVGPLAGLEAGLRARLYRVSVDEQWGFYLQAQAAVGLAVRFGGPPRARAGRRHRQREAR